MKKNIIIIFILIMISFFLIDTKSTHKKNFFSKLKNKYFITVVEEKLKSDENIKRKIIIFDGEKEILSFDVGKEASILSVEDGKIFYYMENEIDKREILEYDIKMKQVVNSTPFPETKTSLIHIKKNRNKIYYSEDYFFSGIKSYKNKLFEYDLEKRKTRKLFEYTGEGLPLITQNEIFFSKNNEIYSFNISNDQISYLWKGNTPFNYEKNFVYYIDENNNIFKKLKNGTGSEKIYTIGKKAKIGGMPVKISDEIYLFIILKPKLIKVEFDVEDTELELVNVTTKDKLNISKIYYRSSFFKEYIGLLTNATAMYVDKEVLR